MWWSFFLLLFFLLFRLRLTLQLFLCFLTDFYILFFLHLSTVLHYILFSYMQCYLCMLRTCSFFFLLSLNPVLPRSQVCTLLTDFWRAVHRPQFCIANVLTPSPPFFFIFFFGGGRRGSSYASYEALQAQYTACGFYQWYYCSFTELE